MAFNKNYDIAILDQWDSDTGAFGKVMLCQNIFDIVNKVYRGTNIEMTKKVL